MKLFLDDYRNPIDCVGYMHSRIGKDNPIYLEKDWIIVRNYNEFINCITNYRALIKLISFDHDLADGHYHKNMQEGQINYDSEDFNQEENKTGYHCIKWLFDYYTKHSISFPRCIVHSMNPVGTQNI